MKEKDIVLALHEPAEIQCAKPQVQRCNVPKIPDETQGYIIMRRTQRVWSICYFLLPGGLPYG